MVVIMNNKIVEPVNSPEDRLRTNKKILTVMVSAAVGATPTAFAQENVLEEVIVTGTRIVTQDGFGRTSPVTVVDMQEIVAAAGWRLT